MSHAGLLFLLGAASWCAAAVALAVLLGRAVRNGAGGPCLDDEDWLAQVPVECLSDSEVDARFDDIAAGMGERTWWA